jgi:hypothetical protein
MHLRNLPANTGVCFEARLEKRRTDVSDRNFGTRCFVRPKVHFPDVATVNLTANNVITNTTYLSPQKRIASKLD